MRPIKKVYITLTAALVIQMPLRHWISIADMAVSSTLVSFLDQAIEWVKYLRYAAAVIKEFK